MKKFRSYLELIRERNFGKYSSLDKLLEEKV